MIPFHHQSVVFEIDLMGFCSFNWKESILTKHYHLKHTKHFSKLTYRICKGHRHYYTSLFQVSSILNQIRIKLKLKLNWFSSLSVFSNKSFGFNICRMFTYQTMKCPRAIRENFEVLNKPIQLLS